MRTKRLVELLNLFAWSVLSLGQAHAGPADDLSARCKALQSDDFSQVLDAPAQIIEAKVVNAGTDTSGYCQVSGYVTPNVGFLMRLPRTNWNGKFIELGCGGACGSTDHIVLCDDPLRRGYACIVSNGGHQSTGADVKWAYNNPKAVIEYAVRASHVTAIAGKVIAERYYETPPRKSYFMGCSAGGEQAVMEAQRFPWDFDGIVAGDPDLSWTEDWMNLVWANRALVSNSGKPLLSQKDLETLHKAVVAKCDLNDGVKDGLIGDPRLCKFSPEELSCTTHKGEGCFSPSQIASIRQIYGGPITKTGTAIAAPHVFMGSELSWLNFFGGSSATPTPFYSYIGDWFRYYLFLPNPGPTWEPKDFDFDRDYKRLGVAEITEPVNPDVRRLKAGGGKLLIYTGWNDAAAGVGRTVDYYESAERVIGGRAKTQEFLRLFVVPGMNHCTLGDGAFGIDYLSYLEKWVEKGQAPDKLIGYHVKLDDLMDKAMGGDQEAWLTLKRRLEFPLDPANVEFSRPIYPYPTQAKYLGHGDPKDAASFGAATR
jgi:feruloyl esterase